MANLPFDSKLLSSERSVALSIGLLAACLCYQAFSTIYNIWFHPLHKYPGSIFGRASYIPRMWYLSQGKESAWVTRLHQKYGSVVRVTPTELSYANTEALKDIYGSGSSMVGRKWKGFYSDRYPQTGSMQFERDDERHSRLRRLFGPAFSDRGLKDQQPMLKQCATTLVRVLMQQIEEQQQQQGKSDDKSSAVVDLVKMYSYITFDVMGELAFGGTFHRLERPSEMAWVSSIFDSLQVGSLLVFEIYFPILRPIFEILLWLNKSKLHTSFNGAANLVDKRLASTNKRVDIWDQMIRSQEADDIKYKKLTLPEMHSNGFLFLVAGTETTATSLAGLTFILLKHPDKLKKLTHEIRSTFASTDDMTTTSLMKLGYLHDCIEEGFRLYPPVSGGLPRMTPEEGATIAGEWVPPQTVVSVAQYAAYHSSENFRRHDEFIPERWSSKEYDSDKKGVLQPFGIGPRNCLGKLLAYHEMRFFLAYMLYYFDLELVGNNANWLDQKVYIVWLKKPLMVKLKPVRPLPN